MHFCQRDSSELIPTRKKSTSRLSNQLLNSLMRSSSVSKAMPPKWRFKGPNNLKSECARSFATNCFFKAVKSAAVSGCERCVPLRHFAAGSVYQCRPILQHSLGGMAFETEDDLISELRNWFDNLDVDFFRVGINSLLSRWQKCIDLHGDYVEK
ncbi:histone-lysine N-methyltransferase SETMAR [Plakobranchus ocellatus]|uniref:Histone-lysine N-methyltransferase SETMAR n=1 Tax=Plakobranchus ocellatus TaxID=259542 RepID=A0AAV4AZ86_9GAST|nr:histone-lysine N-methyltransferase SETMAR [Plakobranchus ocellatus]